MRPKILKLMKALNLIMNRKIFYQKNYKITNASTKTKKEKTQKRKIKIKKKLLIGLCKEIKAK